MLKSPDVFFLKLHYLTIQVVCWGLCLPSKNCLFSLQIQNLMLQTKITEYADRTLALHEIAFRYKIQVNVVASNLKRTKNGLLSASYPETTYQINHVAGKKRGKTCAIELQLVLISLLIG